MQLFSYRVFKYIANSAVQVQVQIDESTENILNIW